MPLARDRSAPVLLAVRDPDVVHRVAVAAHLAARTITCEPKPPVRLPLAGLVLVRIPARALEEHTLGHPRSVLSPPHESRMRLRGDSPVDPVAPTHAKGLE